MGIESFWALVVAIAVPIGACIGAAIGFAVQYRQLKQLELERTKLQLEIDHLKRRAADGERRIVPATDQDIKIYARASRDNEVRFKLKGPEPEPEPLLEMLRRNWFDFMMYGFLVYLAIHILIDLFNFGRWIWMTF